MNIYIHRVIHTLIRLWYDPNCFVLFLFLFCLINEGFIYIIKKGVSLKLKGYFLCQYIWLNSALELING